MADIAFDRNVLNPLEKYLSKDWNQAQSQLDRALRDVLQALFAVRSADDDLSNAPANGFIGDGFRVRPQNPLALAVNVGAGIGFIQDSGSVPTSISGLVGLDDRSAYKPVILSSAQSISLAAPPAGPNSRVDIIEVCYNRLLGNAQTRDILDPTSGTFNPTAGINKTLGFGLDGLIGQVNAPSNSTAAIGYKVGVAANPGAVPSTSPGYVKIAEIFVNNGVVTVDSDAIRDYRPLLFTGGVARAGFRVFPTAYDGSGAAALTDLVAPPGTFVVATAADAGGAGYPGNTYIPMEVFVIAGGSLSGIVPTITPGPTALGATGTGQIDAVKVYGYGSGVLTSSQASRILAGTPSVKVAAGQPYRSVRFYTTTQAAGVTQSPSAAGTLTSYHVDLLLKRS